MKRNVGLGVMAASILAVGAAHAGIGMQIETEKDRRRRKEMDDLFANDPPATLGTADYSEIERRVVGMMPELGTPYDESYHLKSGRMLTGADLGPMNSPKGPAAPGPDEPMPDRFSVNPESPFYDERWASIRIGVRFDGSDRPGDVEEYCVSEGWIRVQMFMKNGKVKRERGKIVCLKRHGKVEPYRK